MEGLQQPPCSRFQSELQDFGSLHSATQASNTGLSNIESVVTLRTELDLRECAVLRSEREAARINGADATTQHGADSAHDVSENPNTESRESTSSCDLGPAGTRFVTEHT